MKPEDEEIDLQPTKTSIEENVVEDGHPEKIPFSQKLKSFFINLPRNTINWIKSWTWKTWLRIVIITILLIAIIVVAVVFRNQVIEYLDKFLNWLPTIDPWGAFLMIGIYIIATVLFVPGSILTLAAGFIWKYWGIIIISVGSTLGATLAFIIGRTLARSWIQKALVKYPKFKAIDQAIAENGWKVVILLRLIPLLPFNLLNYALALTSVGFVGYVLASWIGMLPGTAMYVLIGWSAGSLADIISGRAGNNWWIQLIIFGTSGIFIVVSFIFITIIARRAIKKYIKEEKQNQPNETTKLETKSSELENEQEGKHHSSHSIPYQNPEPLVVPPINVPDETNNQD